MKRAALYMRVSTLDQHPETQLHDLRQMAGQRGYEIIHKYTDRISGAKARRPGLDQMMADARRGGSTSPWSGRQTGSPGRSNTFSTSWTN
jgi:DNA invertase Pin-like site-specific DNA recombinase